MEPVRVCAVGTGRAGMVHARNYRHNVPGAELVALVDADMDRAQRAGRDLGVDECFSTLEQALREADVDAVCIATPTFTHCDLAVEAARAGKHVFVEKPMALSADEAQAMIQASEEARVRLQIGFMRRFDPGFRSAYESLRDGAIGDVVMVRSLSRGPGLPPPWACAMRTSNGMLAEVNSHDFDTIRWLGGGEFARIHVEAATLKRPDLLEAFPEFYDSAVMTGRLQNGVLLQLDGCCPADYGYDARVEILGSKGVMFIGQVAPTELVICTKQAGSMSSNYASWRDRFRAAYVAEACHFIDCIVHGRKPSVTGEDGRAVVLAVQAATESIRTGMPVNLV